MPRQRASNLLYKAKLTKKFLNNLLKLKSPMNKSRHRKSKEFCTSLTKVFS